MFPEAPDPHPRRIAAGRCRRRGDQSGARAVRDVGEEPDELGRGADADGVDPHAERRIQHARGLGGRHVGMRIGAVVPDLEAGGARDHHRVLVLHAVREHDDVALRNGDDVGRFQRRHVRGSPPALAVAVGREAVRWGVGEERARFPRKRRRAAGRGGERVDWLPTYVAPIRCGAASTPRGMNSSAEAFRHRPWTDSSGTGSRLLPETSRTAPPQPAGYARQVARVAHGSSRPGFW